jgi:5-methylthioribose kinase
MRQLNHAHIFEIPLQPANGLDLEALTPGLAQVATSLKKDPRYCRETARLGREAYLTDGPCLLHGDFFPGSLLRTTAGPRVIDPEFGFFGRPEFDAGVFLAHLTLSGQPTHLAQAWRSTYAAPPEFDDTLMRQLTGVEIMRRLIGYAQLPLGYGLARKQELLELSRELVLEPRAHSLLPV